MGDQRFTTTYAMYANLSDPQLRSARFALEELVGAFAMRNRLDETWPEVVSEATAHGVDVSEVVEPVRLGLASATAAGLYELERQMGEVDQILVEREGRTNPAAGRFRRGARARSAALAHGAPEADAESGGAVRVSRQANVSRPTRVGIMAYDSDCVTFVADV